MAVAPPEAPRRLGTGRQGQRARPLSRLATQRDCASTHLLLHLILGSRQTGVQRAIESGLKPSLFVPKSRPLHSKPKSPVRGQAAWLSHWSPSPHFFTRKQEGTAVTACAQQHCCEEDKLHVWLEQREKHHGVDAVMSSALSVSVCCLLRKGEGAAVRVRQPGQLLRVPH